MGKCNRTQEQFLLPLNNYKNKKNKVYSNIEKLKNFNWFLDFSGIKHLSLISYMIFTNLVQYLPIIASTTVAK